MIGSYHPAQSQSSHTLGPIGQWSGRSRRDSVPFILLLRLPTRDRRRHMLTHQVVFSMDAGHALSPWALRQATPGDTLSTSIRMPMPGLHTLHTSMSLPLPRDTVFA